MKTVKIRIVSGIFLLHLVGFSCARSGVDKQNISDFSILKIDLFSEPRQKLTSLSQIASGIEYIPLSTSKEAIIKFIDKIRISGRKIYLKVNATELMCFSKEGQYLFKLDKKGRGPGEYTSITDCDISTDGKSLVILSKDKIHWYGITESAFIYSNSITLQQPAPLYISFIPGTHNLLLSIPPWMGTEEALNILIDKNGDTLVLKNNSYKYEKSESINSFSTNDAIQYVADSQVYFKEVWSDTVFSVNKESDIFQPALIFDSHGTVSNTKFRSDPDYGKKHKNDYSQIGSVSEVNRFIFYRCMLKGQIFSLVYDKINNEKYEIDAELMPKDDLSGGPRFKINPNNVSAGLFYSSVEAITLKRYLQSDEFERENSANDPKKDQLKRIAVSLNDSDNPVLVLVTPKE
jgi:hypothetical protein